MNVDDLLLALTFHWRSDTSKFPNERQRVQLPAIMIFTAYTASRPAELVNGSKTLKSRRIKTNNSMNSWNELNDSDFNDDEKKNNSKKFQSFCYQNIDFMFFRNSKTQIKKFFAMKMFLNHFKKIKNHKKQIFFNFCVQLSAIWVSLHKFEFLQNFCERKQHHRLIEIFLIIG